MTPQEIAQIAFILIFGISLLIPTIRRHQIAPERLKRGTPTHDTKENRP